MQHNFDFRALRESLMKKSRSKVGDLVSQLALQIAP